MSIGNDLEKDYMLYVFKGTNFSQPPTYLSLHTSSPTESGDASGTEVRTGESDGYARQQVGTSGWSDDGDVSGKYTVSNANKITFGPATADWGTIDYIGIFGTGTEGDGSNFLWYGQLDSSVTINNNDEFIIPIGSLEVQLD